MEIKASKKKSYLALIACGVFIFFSIELLLTQNKFSIYIFKNEYFIRLFGLLGLIFFGVTVYKIIIRLKSNNITLIIDNVGILDSSINTTYINWSDIKSIRIKSVMSTKLLLIDVINPDFYLNHSVDKASLNIMKSNSKVYNTPIVLSSNFWNCSFDELESLVKNEYNKHKKL